MPILVYSLSKLSGMKVESPWSDLLIWYSLVCTHLNLFAYLLTSSFIISAEFAAREKLC